MIVNSKTKQKPKTILGRIRNLVLDFTLYFVTAYIIKLQNYYNEKCTCNAVIPWNLLYALKIWNCLNFIQKRKLIFFFFA